MSKVTNREERDSEPRPANVFSMTHDKEGNEFTLYFAERYIRHNFAEKDGALIDVPSTEFSDVATILMSRKQAKALYKLLKNAFAAEDED